MYGAPPPAPAYYPPPAPPAYPVAPVAPVAPTYYPPGAPGAVPGGPTVITIQGNDNSSGGAICPVCGTST